MNVKNAIQQTSKEIVERTGLCLEKHITDPMKEQSPFVYVGSWQDKPNTLHYLRDSSMEHVLACAPCRSGKTTALVIPTLLAWNQSAVIYDSRNELWSLTAGWRQQHAKNKVLRFEPASSDSGVARWNPLNEIRFDDKTGCFDVGDVENLVALMIDPEGKGLETYWQKTAFSLLIGVILHVLYLKRANSVKANLATVDAMLFSPEQASAELWEEMINNRHNNGLRNELVAAAGQAMKSLPQEEGDSVLSTVKSYLALYRDPIVKRNTVVSDFFINDLMNDESPLSLYIVREPYQIAVRSLIQLLLNMIIRRLAGHRHHHPLLLMLDEAPSLGRLSRLQESLPLLTQSGIKLYWIFQDLSQIKSAYGQVIIENCQVQVFYTPNRIETATYLSTITGQSAEQILRMPWPVKNANGNGEIETRGDTIVYVAGFPAIVSKQSFYFKDPILQQRSQIPAPQASDMPRSV